MDHDFPRQTEWLETDGLGGYAMGTVSTVRTRRYHGLLCAATQPPLGRMLLVNGFDAFVSTPEGDYALSSQAYLPGVISPDGYTRLLSFQIDPWPTWTWRMDDGTQVEHELFMIHGTPLVALCWRLCSPREGIGLNVRPLISGRDYHGVHIQNPVLSFEVERFVNKVVWQPYEGVPAIVAFSNGEYRHDPQWYQHFFYALERERGLEDVEDLAAPGVFRFNLSAREAVLMFCAEGHDYFAATYGDQPATMFANMRSEELTRRQAFATPLHRAADQYLAERGNGLTLMAGYPWFTDWGRDTFVAMRGLCLATGRLREAEQILLQWAGMVNQGMLPNCFPDFDGVLNYASVDASLWFVIVVSEYIEQADDADPDVVYQLSQACLDIIHGYRKGTRFNIHMDADGLLHAGEEGLQLTWMDAKIGDLVITPRRGKPVELQALWINALELASAWEPRLRPDAARAREAFLPKFWNAEFGCLYDVQDVDGKPGVADATIRPNQIFALGGLPRALIDGEQARSMLAVIEKELLTPIGLRSLAPDDAGYAPHYFGGIVQRDSAYHQGTVWPWLMGAFTEAWLKVHGNTPETRQEARQRFLLPLCGQLYNSGLGHLPEIADAEPPHAPRGCPFQAWSLGELLRMKLKILADSPAKVGEPVGSFNMQAKV